MQPFSQPTTARELSSQGNESEVPERWNKAHTHTHGGSMATSQGGISLGSAGSEVARNALG